MYIYGDLFAFVSRVYLQLAVLNTISEPPWVRLAVRSPLKDQVLRFQYYSPWTTADVRELSKIKSFYLKELLVLFA